MKHLFSRRLTVSPISDLRRAFACSVRKTRPATASILTGEYPIRHGAITLENAIAPEVASLAEGVRGPRGAGARGCARRVVAVPGEGLSMERSETTYAKTEEGYLAYQVLREGPDLLFTTSPIHNIDVMWEQPSIARFFGRLATFGRLISYNPRGTGVSSPLPPGSSLQEWMDDLRRIMDAVGVQRATIIGDTEGGPTAMLFAATYPERTSALVLVNTFARFIRDVAYPWGIPPESVPRLTERFEEMYGTGALTETMAPSLASDVRFREWFARYQRLSMAGPGVAETGYRSYLLELDVRQILSTIRAPTLVLHRAENRFVRVVTAATSVKRSPARPTSSSPVVMLSTMRAEPTRSPTRSRRSSPAFAANLTLIVSATVLFTDLVASTERATELGDRRWRYVLDGHDRITARHVDHFRGRLVKTMGDGVLATFDGPARAIRCARAVVEEVRRAHGVDVRSGLHTGEVELRGEDVGGIGVHIAARVMAEARPSEVLASSTVKDLVVGSGIEFEDRGEHALKGVPGEWRLYAVVGGHSHHYGR